MSDPNLSIESTQLLRELRRPSFPPQANTTSLFRPILQSVQFNHIMVRIGIRPLPSRFPQCKELEAMNCRLCMLHSNISYRQTCHCEFPAPRYVRRPTVSSMLRITGLQGRVVVPRRFFVRALVRILDQWHLQHKCKHLSGLPLRLSVSFRHISTWTPKKSSCVSTNSLKNANPRSVVHVTSLLHRDIRSFGNMIILAQSWSIGG